MNKAFRVIWSRVKERWVAVSEMISAKGSCPLASVGAICLAALLLTGAPAFALDSTALPTGGTITSGSGSITTSGSQMTVNQASQKMVANWETFNIGTEAGVTFSQPNSSATALNRITDQNPSEILGSLSANGQVFLVNPSGIIFGSTAQVNVGGLVASSLDIADEDFLNGNYSFANNGTAGGISNAGVINASDGGYVAFLSPVINNEGTVSADGGTVAMAAGDKVNLDFSGDGLISFTLDQGAVDAQIENSGLILADGGAVLLTAKAADELTSAVVNNSGVIEARGITSDGGRIVLYADGGQTAVSGTLDTSSDNGTGGSVIATGEYVLIESGAHLNASGASGGGEVLVGGSWQGSDDSIHEATGTIVESGAYLEANATVLGDGGTVVAWSDVDNEDSVTRAYGTFEADGGPNGGNGGRIETSGHWLHTAGVTGSAAAVQGEAGLWLFDPYNVEITSASVNGGWDGGSPDTWTPIGTPSTILNTDISSRLSGGTDVVVTTDGGGVEAGNIKVSAALSIASGRTLSLLADGAVTINAGISGAGGRLVLESGKTGTAGQAVTINSPINLAGGRLKITSTGGAQSNAEIDAYGLLELYGTGDFNLNSTSGSSDFDYFTANVDGSIDLYENYDFFHITPAGVTATGNVNLRVMRSFDVDGPIDITGAGNLTLTVNTGSYIRVSDAVSLANGALSFVTEIGSSTYTVADSITSSGGGLSFDQAVTLIGTPTIACNGTLAFSSTLTPASGSNTTLTANDFSFSGNVVGDGTQQITLRPYTASYNIDLGTGAGTGNLVLTSAELALLQNFSSITIGRSDGTGTTVLVGDVATDLSGTLSLFNSIVDLSGQSLSNSSGGITIGADTLTLDASTQLSGTGALTIKPATSGETVGVAGGAGTLQVAASSFTDNFSTDFSSIIIGDTTAGDLSVGTDAITYGSSLFLITDEDISIASNASITGAGDALVLNADAGEDGGGITIGAGTTIDTGGGNLIMGGGTCTTSSASALAIGTGSTGSSGVKIGSSGGAAVSLQTGGGNIVIKGQGPTTGGRGVSMYATDVDSGASGSVYIRGDGWYTGSVGGNGHAVVLEEGTAIRGGSGGMTMDANANINAGGQWSYPIILGDASTNIYTTNGGTMTLNLDAPLPSLAADTNYVMYGNGSIGGANQNGNVVINTTGGSLVDLSLRPVTIPTGNLTINANRGVTSGSATLVVGGATTVAAGGAYDVSFNSANVNLTSLSCTNVRNLTVLDSDTLQLGTINVTGPVDIATSTGDMTVTQNIVTTDTSDSAVVLNACKDASAGTAAGGDIIFSGSPTVTVGSGGRATLYSGSAEGSTGVADLAGSDNVYYLSDETTVDFDPALAAGTYAIFRGEEAQDPEPVAGAASNVVDRVVNNALNTPTETGTQNARTAFDAATGTSGLINQSLETGGTLTLATNTSISILNFERNGNTLTLAPGAGPREEAMSNVGLLPVFTKGADGSVQSRGGYMVNEGSSVISLTGVYSVKDVGLDETGLNSAQSVSFSLSLSDGTTGDLTAALTENGVLVISGADEATEMDMEQVVLMGLQTLKQETNIDLREIRAVLVNTGKGRAGISV